METKFITFEKESSMAKWLRNLLTYILLWIIPTPFVSVYYDSQVTIAKAKSKIFNGNDNWLWDALSTIWKSIPKVQIKHIYNDWKLVFTIYTYLRVHP